MRWLPNCPPVIGLKPEVHPSVASYCYVFCFARPRDSDYEPLSSGSSSSVPSIKRGRARRPPFPQVVFRGHDSSQRYSKRGHLENRAGGLLLRLLGNRPLPRKE